MLDQLALIALGWLGWTEEQLLYSDINAIMVAYRGRIDMLRAIFGSGNDTPPPLTPTAFDALFGGSDA